MEDLRRSWKVPYIVYYCYLFERKLDLVRLRVDEFEEAIIDDCGMGRNLKITSLLQKLLKPFINKSIDSTNFEHFLFSVLEKYQLDYLLNSSQTKSIDDEDDDNIPRERWSNLSMLTKLDIIYNLCELRIQLSDIEAKLGDYKPNEIRIEPLSVDSMGNKLWYFGDLRLYEEKKEINNKSTKKTIQNNNGSKNELNTWRCVCVTLDDWNNLNEKYKSSKSKLDQEISKLIESSYLPEMYALFQKAERERKHQLLAMAPKRQSQRLQQKQPYQETSNKENINDSKSIDNVFISSDDHSSSNSSQSNDCIDLTVEDEIQSKEKISLKREERLKQRLLKCENNH